MMQNRKRWAASSGALLLTSALLAACTAGGPAGNESKGNDSPKTAEPASKTQPSGLNATGFPIVNQPVTLTMMSAKNALHAEWKDMKVLQEYEKKTNIKIQWNSAPDNGFIERRNIALASGDLPDAFYRGQLTTMDMVNYGTQGILIPLNDLIEKYAPNLKAVFQKYPEVKKSITAPDGKIYALPQVIDHVSPRATKMFINKKWLDKLGLPMPQTTDELYTTFKAFKEKDPNGNGKADEVPWSGDKSEFKLWLGLRGAWGLGNGGNNDKIDFGPDGKLRVYVMDPRYKELLEFMAKMYKDGLIDKEVFAQDPPQLYAKGFAQTVGSASGNNIGFIVGPNYVDDYVGVPALKGPHGDQLFSPVSPNILSQGTFAITSKNKYPEATMRWVDFFYSEEGAKFLRMGIEGETYKTNPDGSVQYTDLIVKNPNGLSLDQAIGQYTTWPGGGVPLYIVEKIDKSGNMYPTAVDATKLVEPYMPKKLLPQLLFTKEEQDQINVLGTDISTYINEMRVKFVTGAAPFSEWDNYVSTLKKMNVDKWLSLNQTAYDRFTKN
ncbi:extracellular solute-binding protein [Paenibacillus thalictri]|uniref:Extracellular solute-binding protein n=1 Tax=Paenibacillus thalictri TaxID=2527873 RepID=A0A4Q9DKK1_9BACL|nr:extracellular solute-binding protein [Paenibacillus thalictri]TBL74566.1 extracellular solute-binding protein [Paenibacillus thalictri]